MIWYFRYFRNDKVNSETRIRILASWIFAFLKKRKTCKMNDLRENFFFESWKLVGPLCHGVGIFFSCIYGGFTTHQLSLWWWSSKRFATLSRRPSHESKWPLFSSDNFKEILQSKRLLPETIVIWGMEEVEVWKWNCCLEWVSDFRNFFMRLLVAWGASNDGYLRRFWVVVWCVW